MTEQAREEFDRHQRRQKTYSDGSEGRPLDDISDPATRGDESSTSIREWFAEHKLGLVIWSGVLLAAIGILLHWAAAFAPALWQNPLLRKTLLGLTLFVVGFFVGVHRFLKILKDTDWFVERLPDGVRIWMGTYEKDRGLFTPVKGFGVSGRQQGTFEVQDLGASFAEFQSKSNPSDEVRIRLMSEATRTDDTWFGTVVAANSRGLEPDPQAREGHLVMVPAADDHYEVLDDMISVIHANEREIRRLEDELSDAKEGRDTWRERAEEREERILDRYTAFTKEVGEAFDPRRQRQSGSKSGGQSADVQQSVDQALRNLGGSDDD